MGVMLLMIMAAMWPPVFHALVMREQYRDYLAAQAEARRPRTLRLTEARPDSVLRRLRHRHVGRMAAPLGRAFLHFRLGFVRVRTRLERHGSSAQP